MAGRLSLWGICFVGTVGLCMSITQGQTPTDQAMRDLLEKEGKSQPTVVEAIPDLTSFDADTLRAICTRLYEVIASQKAELVNLKSELAVAQQDLEQVNKYLHNEELYPDFLAQADLPDTSAEERWREYRTAQMRRDEDTLRFRQMQERKEIEKKAADDAPRWDSNCSLGLIIADKYREIIYFDSVRGMVLHSDKTVYDRKNVMVRGTFTNNATIPYRYTFTIKVAGEQSPVLERQWAGPPSIGSWRYQTPVLFPGNLHTFEVKVSLSADISQIIGCMIDDIIADRPPVSP